MNPMEKKSIEDSIRNESKGLLPEYIPHEMTPEGMEDARWEVIQRSEKKWEIERGTDIARMPKDVLIAHVMIQGFYPKGNTHVEENDWRKKLEILMENQERENFEVSCSIVQVDNFTGNNLFSPLPPGVILGKGNVTSAWYGDSGSRIIENSTRRTKDSENSDSDRVLEMTREVVQTSRVQSHKERSYNELHVDKIGVKALFYQLEGGRSYSYTSSRYPHDYYVSFKDFWEMTEQYDLPRVIFFQGRMYQVVTKKKLFDVVKMPDGRSKVFLRDVGKPVLTDREILYDDKEYRLSESDSHWEKLTGAPVEKEELLVISLGEDVTEEIQEITL